MRRIQTGVIAVCLAAALLSGCAGSSAQSTASSTAASSAAASCISTTAVSANYDGGSGTQEDPYQINSVDSLLTFASNVNDGSQGGYAGVSFKLTSDLDLSGVEWAPIGNMNDMETHSTLFLGSFDGDGHTISNLNYTSDVYNCGAGLFGVSCGEVKNLTLENATVAVTEGTSMAIGGVVGYNMGSVDNVTLKGDSTITGNNCVGGIVGGRLTDLWKAGATAALSHGIALCGLLLVFLLPGNHATTALLTFIIGFALFFNSSPQQLLMVQAGGGRGGGRQSPWRKSFRTAMNRGFVRAMLSRGWHSLSASLPSPSASQTPLPKGEASVRPPKFR